MTASRLEREAHAIREIEQTWHRCDPIVDALRADWPSERVMATYGATYREIKRARRQISREDAARRNDCCIRDVGEYECAPEVLVTPSGTTCLSIPSEPEGRPLS
jgi:hypothetical protein